MGTPYPFDESRLLGGVEAVAFHLVSALAKTDDIELHVVSCNKIVKRSFKEVRGTVTFYWLASGSRFHILRSATINAWRVRKVYENIQPDIIHCQTEAYALAAPRNFPVIMTIHGVEVFVSCMKKTSHFKGLTGLSRQWGLKSNIKAGLRKAQTIISIAGDYLPQVMSPLLDSKAVYNIPNPLSESIWDKVVSNTEVDGQILCVGSIIERKNAIFLVQAFAEVIKQFPNARLYFAGEIREQAYYNRLLYEISAHGLDDKITLTGGLNQSQLFEAYGKACIVVLPSIHETAPMVVAEAMAFGKPVVATRVAAVPWMVEDGVTGYLVKVGDKESMTARILDILQDKLKRVRMGKAAKKVSRQRFGADVVAENTVQVYRKLLQA